MTVGATLEATETTTGGGTAAAEGCWSRQLRVGLQFLAHL